MNFESFDILCHLHFTLTCVDRVKRDLHTKPNWACFVGYFRIINPCLFGVFFVVVLFCVFFFFYYKEVSFLFCFVFVFVLIIKKFPEANCLRNWRMTLKFSRLELLIKTIFCMFWSTTQELFGQLKFQCHFSVSQTILLQDNYQ